MQPENWSPRYEVTLRTVQRDLNGVGLLELEVQNGSYRVAASKLGELSLQDITRFAEIAQAGRPYPQLNDIDPPLAANQLPKRPARAWPQL